MIIEHREIKRITKIEITRIKTLRQFYKPAVIAKMTGRTEGSINQILHREKKKGAVYPKLRHGRLVHDKKKAMEWREMVKSGKNYRDIQQEQNVNPATICRVLALEARDELKW